MARRGRHWCAGSGLEGGGHQVIRVSCLRGQHRLLLPPLPPSQTDRVSVAPGGRSVSCLPLWCLSSAVAMPWPCSSSLPRRRRPHRLLRAGSRQQGQAAFLPSWALSWGCPGPSKRRSRPPPRPSSLRLPPRMECRLPQPGPADPQDAARPLPCAPALSPHTSIPALPGGEGPGSWGVTSSLTPCPVCGTPAHLQHSSQERLSEPSCRFLRWN